MVHMYSMLVGRSHTPAIELPRTGHVAHLGSLPADFFVPTASHQAVKTFPVVIVSRLICRYIHHLSPLSKSVPNHILHKYSDEMSRKYEVVVLGVLMKNERYAGYYAQDAGIPGRELPI